jgi:hypothetical protein
MSIDLGELVARFELFDDTRYLSQLLYDLAKSGEESLSIDGQYTIVASRHNLEGLYDLCMGFVAAHKRRESEVLQGCEGTTNDAGGCAPGAGEPVQRDRSDESRARVGHTP